MMNEKNALAQTPKVPFTELRLARLPTELDSNKTKEQQSLTPGLVVKLEYISLKKNTLIIIWPRSFAQ